MKKINWKTLIISILIPLALGALIGLITNSVVDYNSFTKPFFAPPSWVFPTVWTLLYILMGISSYLIIEDNSYDKSIAMILYVIQLIVNLLWSIIFFVFDWKLFAFIWIILLIILVSLMIKSFSKVNKKAALLQLPYLIWLIFAAVLNLSIVLLN